MTRPTLLMLHGWGFDATLWDAVRALLPDYATIACDRGYFGPRAASPPPEGPVLAIGHSLGALLLALEPPKDGIGLIAVNGFDRFTGEGGVAARVVDRMLRRFAEAPDAVLADFRTRCGGDAAPERIDAARLAADLDILAEADARRMELPPTLVLHGSDDPLLPAPMREAGFAGAPRATLEGAGHLLPLTHPHWVAERIRAFAA